MDNSAMHKQYGTTVHHPVGQSAVLIETARRTCLLWAPCRALGTSQLRVLTGASAMAPVKRQSLDQVTIGIVCLSNTA